MEAEFHNPAPGQEDQSGSTQKLRLQEDCEDIIGGARQADQLEGLHPGDDPELKNSEQRLGSPPVSHVDNGDPKNEHAYPTDEQKWPENKTPTK